MSVTLDIARTYRAPREVLRRRMAGPAREDRALAILMAACVLIFVAQWPRLSRMAYLDGTFPLDQLMAGALMGWIVFAPLFFYALALIAHLVLKAIGSAATGFQSRMALFWALLAASPLWLLTGLTAGFVGEGPALTIVGVLALAAFLVFWGAGLIELSGRRNEETA